MVSRMGICITVCLLMVPLAGILPCTDFVERWIGPWIHWIASPLFVIGGVCLRFTLDSCGCGIIGLSLLAVGAIAWITMWGCPYMIATPYLDGTLSITELVNYDQGMFILKDGEALVDRFETYKRNRYGWTTAVVAPLVTSVAAYRHNATNNNNSLAGIVVGWGISYTSTPPGYWKYPSFHEGFMSPASQHDWVRGTLFLFFVPSSRLIFGIQMP